jgi:hypothetical protein
MDKTHEPMPDIPILRPITDVPHLPKIMADVRDETYKLLALEAEERTRRNQSRQSTKEPHQ